MVFPDPSLSQAEKLQISQFAFVGEVLQTSEHPLQQLHVFLMLGPQSSMQHYRWGLTRTEQKETITSLTYQPQCHPGYSWLSGQQAHSARSHQC